MSSCEHGNRYSVPWQAGNFLTTWATVSFSQKLRCLELVHTDWKTDRQTNGLKDFNAAPRHLERSQKCKIVKHRFMCKRLCFNLSCCWKWKRCDTHYCTALRTHNSQAMGQSWWWRHMSRGCLALPLHPLRPSPRNRQPLALTDRDFCLLMCFRLFSHSPLTFNSAPTFSTHTSQTTGAATTNENVVISTFSVCVPWSYCNTAVTNV